MKVAKSDIIAAVKAAGKLYPGEFVSDYRRRKIDATAAIVKAIYGIDNLETIESYCDVLTDGTASTKYPERLAAKGNYFGAISAAFENACGNVNGPATQLAMFKLCKFIDIHLPETILVPEFGEHTWNF